jgi:hypothetical protein
MIAAEDECSWEGDEDRCEKVFADARTLAEKNGWDVREITLVVEDAKVYGAFEPVKIDAEVAS